MFSCKLKKYWKRPDLKMMLGKKDQGAKLEIWHCPTALFERGKGYVYGWKLTQF